MGKKVIGIDLGHCETAAAYVREYDGDYESGRISVTNTKDPIILSQILLTNDQMLMLRGHNRPSYELLRELGEIRIGNDLSESISEGERFCYFKAAPKHFDEPYGESRMAKDAEITRGMLTACFVYALLGNILAYNPNITDESERKELTLLIGCPSMPDWTSGEARSSYANLIKNATGVNDVRIVPESRAAMYSSIENSKNMVSAVDGAVVFDFGSSTADCTYMLLGKKMIEYSWPLGASEIECNMLLHAREEAAKVSKLHESEEDIMVRNKNELRDAKERYYRGIYGPKGHPVICVFEEETVKLRGDIRTVRWKEKLQTLVVDNTLMEEATNGRKLQLKSADNVVRSGTWQSLCRDFFEEAAKLIKKEKVPVKTVILTGGASRMDFVFRLCREVFPDPVKIILERNPSHTVSNGLVWVAASDFKAPVCENNAKAEVMGNSSCSTDTLRENLKDALYAKICTIVEECTNSWASQPGDEATARQLTTAIENRLKSREVQEEVKEIFSKEIEEWKDSLSTVMVQAVNNQVKNIYAECMAKNFILPKDVWKQLSKDSLNIGKVDVTKLLEEMDMSDMLLKICRVAVGIAIWVIGCCFGIPGIIIGGLLALLAQNVIKDSDLDRKRKRDIRIKVAEKMRGELQKEKEKIMKEFDNSITECVKGYQDNVENNLHTAFEIIMMKRFESVING